MVNRSILILVVLTFSTLILAQDNSAVSQQGNAVLWEAVDVSSRDLYVGPAGTLQPKFENVKFLGRQAGGNNLKYRIKDGNGVEWVVKAADESQAEVAATRLLWALGYRTEIDVLVSRFNVEKIGSYKNVRLEARPEQVKRLDRWSWNSNPFLKTRELDGLKIMMALINNWDLKDENTVIIKEGDKQYYMVSDLGSSFGKLADKDFSRTGRSVNKPEDYAKAEFIKGVNGGVIEFHYRGMAQNLMDGITVENARWLADLLLQLSDKQIEDAFRAANYKPEDVQTYAAAVKARIRALDEATKQAAAETAG
jgi:hypothetical protein